jgi:hypothetical protein
VGARPKPDTVAALTANAKSAGFIIALLRTLAQDPRSKDDIDNQDWFSFRFNFGVLARPSGAVFA